MSIATVSLTLLLLPESLAICRLDTTAEIPAWAIHTPFFSVTRTMAELSIVCPAAQIPADMACEANWRAFQLSGTFDLTLVGIIGRVAEPLAAAAVSIFPIATYDTDYILVRQSQLEAAIAALTQAGHTVVPAS